VMSAVTIGLQRFATSSCEADNNAPPNTLAIQANHDTRRQLGRFLRGKRPNVRRKGRPQVGEARLWTSP
jgi:hypothetical protein